MSQDFGKSCCGCCPKDCQEHINLRAQDRFHIYILGVDGRKTFVHMGNDADEAYKIHATLTKQFLDLGWNKDGTPHVVIGHIEPWMKTKYEEMWQHIESGKGAVTYYDPSDY